MKQTILNDRPLYDRSDELCLTRLLVKWGFFGLAMWWLSGTAFGSHAFVWLIGLGVAFALLRKEFQA